MPKRRSLIRFLFVLFVAVGVSACGSAATPTAAPPAQSAPVATPVPEGALISQPLAPILDGPIEIVDVTAQSAVVKVTTNRDVACAVVYGVDTGFGQLSLDQNMGGSAHRNHQVVLRGLQPDTEYFYRFQGSDTEGNFYAGEVRTFRTAPAETTADLGIDVATLALGARIVAVSSNYGGGDDDSTYGANHAIDEDPTTEWSSNGDGNDAFITVELPEPVEVSGFGLWTRTMGSSAQISRFQVENETGEVFGPFTISDATRTYTFPARGRGQRFTFRVLESSGGNTGAVEIAVFAAP